MKAIWMLTTVVAMSVTASVGAQSAKATGKAANDKTMSTTYTGCVESVNHGAWFVLTRVDTADREARHRDMAMTHHDDMAMKGEAARMQSGPTPMADDTMDAMPSKSFALTGAANLSRYVGQQVSVTGSLSNRPIGTMRHDMSTLTVKTLKVVAASCS
jgi:hypothetical protein